ncbi:MAG: transporter [Steroidobacteraceae bacterium]
MRPRCTSFSSLSILAIALGADSIAQGQSMEPRLYSNAPVGLNFLINTFAYQTGSVLVDTSLPISNVSATVDTAAVAYSRAIDCWGDSGSVQLALPYAHATASGDVFEQSRSVTRDGLGDLALRFAVNLYGAPAVDLKQFANYQQDVIIGVSLQVTAPSGQYDAAKLVNIGTNRWSFLPQAGMSKAVGNWTLEVAAGVQFFTANEEFFGNNVRRQDPLFSTQGHVIYNFNPKLWAALDATYYTGGRTSVNGTLNENLEHDSRWGATTGYTFTRRNSVKFYFSSGLIARTGTDFKVYGIAWQYRWGAGL